MFREMFRERPSDKSTTVVAPPRMFTWEMGVRKWGWSNWFATNDSPDDRMLMGTTSAEERADITAFRSWLHYCATKPCPTKGG